MRDRDLHPDLAPPLDETARAEEGRETIESTGLAVNEFLMINGTRVPAYVVARLWEAGLPASTRPTGVQEAHVTLAENPLHEIERILDLEPAR